MARAWITLVDRFGYQRWCAPGGDFGWAVTDQIAQLAPLGLVGTHLNSAAFGPTPQEFADDTPAEQAAFASTANSLRPALRLQEGAGHPPPDHRALPGRPPGRPGGYSILQDLWGALGDTEASSSLDDMLDDIMMSSSPNSAASSARPCWAMARGGWAPPATVEDPLTHPVGTMPPHERPRRSLRQLERRDSNIVFHHEPDAGGHFFASSSPRPSSRTSAAPPRPNEGETLHANQPADRRPSERTAVSNVHPHDPTWLRWLWWPGTTPTDNPPLLQSGNADGALARCRVTGIRPARGTALESGTLILSLDEPPPAMRQALPAHLHPHGRPCRPSQRPLPAPGQAMSTRHAHPSVGARRTLAASPAA